MPFFICKIWLFFILIFRIINKKKCFSFPKYFLILGHRGDQASAAENTLSSFKIAMDHGAHGVEFDVTLSKDLVPVVIHDDTLNRTTNASGWVSDYNAIELNNFDATKTYKGHKEGVPCLLETLNCLPDKAIANIELKKTRLPNELFIDKVLAISSQHENRLLILFSSFDGEILRLLRAKHERALIALLLCHDERWLYSLSYWRAIKPDVLHLHYKMIKPWLCKLALWAKIPLLAWTVNDEKIAHYFYEKKLTGIFTDNVKMMTNKFYNKL